ncbi:MAG TPA: hypothetical protein VK363_13790 [Pyrinomonadaceae bacterium]|nr:hypothetical protein [Pyrinomonadaceae bacterium]
MNQTMTTAKDGSSLRRGIGTFVLFVRKSLGLPPPRPRVHFKLGSLEVPENLLKIDLQLTDKYQGFSAELVRLTLLGIAVFGFFYKEASEAITNDRWAKGLFSISVMMFACSAGAALFHRYFSTDSISCYIRYLRLLQRRQGLILLETPLAGADNLESEAEAAREWLAAIGDEPKVMLSLVEAEIARERAKWHKALNYSKIGLLLSATLLSGGALCLAAAFVKIIS